MIKKLLRLIIYLKLIQNCTFLWANTYCSWISCYAVFVHYFKVNINFFIEDFLDFKD